MPNNCGVRTGKNRKSLVPSQGFYFYFLYCCGVKPRASCTEHPLSGNENSDLYHISFLFWPTRHSGPNFTSTIAYLTSDLKSLKIEFPFIFHAFVLLIFCIVFWDFMRAVEFMLYLPSYDLTRNKLSACTWQLRLLYVRYTSTGWHMTGRQQPQWASADEWMNGNEWRVLMVSLKHGCKNGAQCQVEPWVPQCCYPANCTGYDHR